MHRRRGRPDPPAPEKDETAQPVTPGPVEPASVTDSTTVLSTTTEEDTGLTAAMMDKAALELYAILQQTQAADSSNLVLEEDGQVTTEEDEVCAC